MRFDRAIILITGNMQGPARSSGLERPWHKIMSADTGGACVVNMPHTHRMDAKAQAAIYSRHIEFDARIDIVAYSYGATAALDLTNAFKFQGRDVHTVVTVDGVRKGLALISRMFKDVNGFSWPNSVRNVWRIYQREDWPLGHRMTVKPGTKLRQIKLRYAHTDIDDQPETHDVIADALGLEL